VERLSSTVSSSSRPGNYGYPDRPSGVPFAQPRQGLLGRQCRGEAADMDGGAIDPADAGDLRRNARALAPTVPAFTVTRLGESIE
jgi:hypothetical protein